MSLARAVTGPMPHTEGPATRAMAWPLSQEKKTRVQIKTVVITLLWAKEYEKYKTRSKQFYPGHFSSQTDGSKPTWVLCLLVEAKTLFDPSLEAGHMTQDTAVTQMIVMALMRLVWF